MVDRDVVQKFKSPTCGEGKILSEFCCGFATSTNRDHIFKDAKRILQVEALAKLREDEDSTDLNVSLRVARANSVGDFIRLMLEIARARFECARVLSH